MPEFLFDMTLNASIRIKAASHEEARATLLELIDAADTNFGAFKNGEPIVGETSIASDSSLRCAEIDGEPYVPTDDERWIHAAEDGHAELKEGPGGIWTAYDTEEESWIVGHSDGARTKAEAARLYCEDRGCEPD